MVSTTIMKGADPREGYVPQLTSIYNGFLLIRCRLCYEKKKKKKN
jgi:hypothetical protein